MPSDANFEGYSVHGFPIVLTLCKPRVLQSFLGECYVVYGADQIKSPFLLMPQAEELCLSLSDLFFISYNYEN